MTTEEVLEAGTLLTLSPNPSWATRESLLWREIGSLVSCVSHCSSATPTQVGNLPLCVGLEGQVHVVCAVPFLHSLGCWLL